VDCCHPAASAPASLLLLFTTGLLMSLGHCLGMCGPIVGAFAVAQGGLERSRWRLLAPLLVFQAGRVSSYAGIGVAVGALGSAAALAGDPRAAMGVVSTLAAAAMLVAGCGLLGLLPFERLLGAGAAGGAVSRAMAGLLRGRGWSSRYLLGVANGFLPCGPVVAAAIAAASTGSAAGGALAMAVYGGGTVPALTLLGLGAGSLGSRLRQRLYRLGAATLLLVGVQLLLRGLHAFGVVGGFRVGPLVLW
jgi:uncharacterized protein